LYRQPAKIPIRFFAFNYIIYGVILFTPPEIVLCFDVLNTAVCCLKCHSLYYIYRFLRCITTRFIVSLHYRLLQEITEKKNVQNLFPRFLKKEKKRDLIISADTPFPIDRFNFLPREADTCMQRQQVCACAVTSMHAYTSDRAAAVPHAWSTTRVCVRSLGGGDWRSTPRRLDGGDKEMYTGGMGRVVTIPAHGILCCE